MHLLVTNIQWDTDGMGVEECCLPTSVLVLDIDPDEIVDVELADESMGLTLDEEIEELLSTTLSDAFGFCHGGYQWQIFDANEVKTHGGGGYYKEGLGVLVLPPRIH